MGGFQKIPTFLTAPEYRLVSYVPNPELGVCYYPEHWPQDLWISDAENMVKTGIKWVRIAEFAWSRIEKSPDNFDFEWLDKIVDILGKAGLKIVMCTPTATPPKWLVDQTPLSLIHI